VEQPAPLRGGFMIYLLEFLALVGIALALAASPFLINLLESIVPARPNRRRAMAAYDSASAASKERSDKERSEMRDEIRRATNIIESKQRSTGRFSPR